MFQATRPTYFLGISGLNSMQCEINCKNDDSQEISSTFKCPIAIKSLFNNRINRFEFEIECISVILNVDSRLEKYRL